MFRLARSTVSRRSLWATFAALTLFAVSAQSIWAAVITIPDSALISSNSYYTDQIGGGIGSVALGPNDDGSTGPINLGFTLNFFGENYTQFYINNNGNITFTNPLSSYTPSGPQVASQPIISPFFADVDTRGSGSGLVYVRTDVANEIIVTWNGVGYYGQHTDKLDSFQLVLRGPSYNIQPGEGSIGFFYESMQWETGDASGGSGGFGGTPAAVGFGDGAGNGEVLQGSIQAGISGIVSDTHIWFDQNLNPVSAPEPASLIMLGFGGLGMIGYGWKRRKAAATAG